MRKPPRRRKDRFSGRARVWSSGGAGRAAAGRNPLPPSSLPRPPLRGEAGGRPDSSHPGQRSPGDARTHEHARAAHAGGGRVVGCRRGGCAPRSARPPSRAQPRGERAPRAGAHARHTALLYRALARLPPRPAFKQLPDVASPGFFASACQPRSVHQYLAGRTAREEGAPSNPLQRQPRHRPGALLSPARRPARSLSTRRRRPLLSAFLASWPIRLLGGWWVWENTSALSIHFHFCYLFFVFLFFVCCFCRVPLQGASPQLSFGGFIHLVKAQGSGHWVPPFLMSPLFASRMRAFFPPIINPVI